MFTWSGSPGDRGVQVFKWVDVFHRGISSVGDDGPIVDQGTPGIGPFSGELLPYFGDYHGGIRCAMNRLHGWNHAQLRETADIVRLDDLSVFDPPSQWAAIQIIFFKKVLVQVQNFPICPVPYGVYAILQSEIDTFLTDRPERGKFGHVVAVPARLVCVLIYHPGTIGSQRPIYIGLGPLYEKTVIG